MVVSPKWIGSVFGIGKAHGWAKVPVFYFNDFLILPVGVSNATDVIPLPSIVKDNLPAGSWSWAVFTNILNISNPSNNAVHLEGSADRVNLTIRVRRTPTRYLCSASPAELGVPFNILDPATGGSEWDGLTTLTPIITPDYHLSQTISYEGFAIIRDTELIEL